MPKFSLAMDSLHQMNDGVLAAIFDREVKKAIDDCRDRPKLDKPREITLTLQIAPHKSEEDDISVSAKVSQAKLPCSVSDDVRMTTSKEGRAHFRSEFSDSPNQQSLFEAAQQGEDVQTEE